MTEPEQLTHHEKTLLLWEAMGREPASTLTDGAEQRDGPRFMVPRAVCRMDLLGKHRGPAIEVRVQDVNARGAGLLSSTALPLRQSVRLHPPIQVGSAIDAVDADVANCRRTRGGYRIGVRFRVVKEE